MYAPAYTPQTTPYQPPQQSEQPLQQPQKPRSETSKLNAFLAECLSVGCLKGFKYFELYLRGREELLLRIYKSTSSKGSISRQPSSMELARSQSKNNLSLKTQKRLMWQSSSEALPPASPCDRELEQDVSKTAFLIAGYARYKCPYVWLRTNHTRFTRFQENAKVDDPLKLETVSNWKNSDDVKISDIIAEIVTITIQPPPTNPFAINHAFYDALPLEESIVCVGAMIDFLQKVYVRDAPYTEGVYGDLQKLHNRHWDEFGELMLGSQALGSKRSSLLATPATA